MSKDFLNLYSVDLKYNRDLHNVDDNVMSVSPQVGKDTRKFVGIVVILDSKKYCIPLTSVKDKFQKKTKDDFIKIPHPSKRNVNGAPETIAVLNLNNMIPVSEFVIQKVDLSKKTPDQNLLINELKWCRENSAVIINRANRLYNKVTLTPEKDRNLTRRCCDFKKLEQVLEKWISKELDKCSEILNANPKLKADLNAAAVEYYRIHNLPPLDSSASIAERYEMQRKVLEANPRLKEEFAKAENKYNLKNEHSQQQPKPKHRR